MVSRRRFGAKLAVVTVVAMLTSAVAPVLSAAPAAAQTPACTNYRIYPLAGDEHFRLPSVGAGGSIDCHLRRGHRNPGVQVLQYLIACNDHALLPDGTFVARDGDFGPITEQALRLVQRDKGITVDGIYGPQTRGATAWPTFRDGTNTFIGCL